MNTPKPLQRTCDEGEQLGPAAGLGGVTSPFASASPETRPRSLMELAWTDQAEGPSCTATRSIAIPRCWRRPTPSSGRRHRALPPLRVTRTTSSLRGERAVLIKRRAIGRQVTTSWSPGRNRIVIYEMLPARSAHAAGPGRRGHQVEPRTATRRALGLITPTTG